MLGYDSISEVAISESRQDVTGSPYYRQQLECEDELMMLKVDTAVVVPINRLPLTDDTDFKTIEDAIAFDATGMDLLWNFMTTTGVLTSTPVTPTNGGTYDWVHRGDGMYSIEIPASGGASINNDTEGYGWFSGRATGVLSFCGPVITFAPANVVEGLVGGAERLRVVNTNGDTIGTLANQVTIASSLAVITSSVNTLLSRITSTLFNGITSLAGWLRIMSRADEPATTDYAVSQSEINANGGSGSGSFSNLTDSLEATSTVVVSSTAVSSQAANNAGRLTVVKYTTFRIQLTGLGDISDREELHFSFKRDIDDEDENAILHMTEADDLQTVEGEAAEDSSLGTIVVDDEDDGDVALYIHADTTGALTATEEGVFYSVKVKRDNGDWDELIDFRNADVRADIVQGVDRHT